MYNSQKKIQIIFAMNLKCSNAKDTQFVVAVQQ